MHYRIKFLVLLILVISMFWGLSCDARLLGLLLSKENHNFGNVNISESKTYTLFINNVSSKPIKITEVKVMGSADFIVTDGGSPVTIFGGGKHQIEIKFEPNVAGKLIGVLNILHDGPGKTRTLNMSGTGIPVPLIELSETVYDFGTVGLALTANHDFEMENTGTANLNISNFNFTANPTLFSITAGGTLPISVSPGAKHTITVQFEPAQVGTFNTILNIVHNAINAVTPLGIEITGSGGGGKLEFNQPDPWDFDLVRINSSKSEEIQLSNDGTTNLDITRIQLQTGQEFRIERLADSNGNVINTPINLTPQDYAVLTVKFTPTSANNYNDSLEVTSDCSYHPSPRVLTITGAGRNPISQVCNYTGSAQNWNVPAGLNNIEVDAYGAEGGQAWDPGLHYGGKGGRVQATLNVTPGATLGVYVGQKGGDGGRNTAGVAGWNGGGRGGIYSLGGYDFSSGGGGGASDIRSGGNALSDRIMVAGAGGGGGFNYFAGGDHGGDGGGLTGADGWSGGYPGGLPYGEPETVGKGGTQTAGGAAAYLYGTAQAGSLGTGGNGSAVYLGGGGGAGYYGGGGGEFGGAGGGSSYTATGATNVTHTQGTRNGNGIVTIIY